MKKETLPKVGAEYDPSAKPLTMDKLLKFQKRTTRIAVNEPGVPIWSFSVDIEEVTEEAIKNAVLHRLAELDPRDCVGPDVTATVVKDDTTIVVHMDPEARLHGGARQEHAGAEIDHEEIEDLRDALEVHCVDYLFIGKTGAILHGLPETAQKADVFLQKTAANGAATVSALKELGFDLTAGQSNDIRRGKDVVEIKNGPFDIDLFFALNGMGRFEAAWSHGVDIDGFPVSSIDDIIAGNQASEGDRDRETLARLRAFLDRLRAPGSKHHPRLPGLNSRNRRGPVAVTRTPRKRDTEQKTRVR